MGLVTNLIYCGLIVGTYRSVSYGFSKMKSKRDWIVLLFGVIIGLVFGLFIGRL